MGIGLTPLIMNTTLYFLRLIALAIAASLLEGTLQAQFRKLSDLDFQQVNVLDDGQWLGTGLGGVFLSANGGESWVKTTFPSQGRPGVGIATRSLVGGGLTFVGAMDDGIWLSRDHGTNWTFTGPVARSFGTGIGRMAYNGTDYVAGYGGSPRGLYRWNGSAWDKTLSGSDGLSVVAGLHGRFLAGMLGGGVVVSDDGGRTWRKTFDSFQFMVRSRDSLLGVSQATGVVRRSDDNGETWSEEGESVPGALSGYLDQPTVHRGALYVPVHGSGIWRRQGDLGWSRVLTNVSWCVPYVVGSSLVVCSSEGLFQLMDGIGPNPRIAAGTLQIVNGFVVGATVTDGGFGYTIAPAITISGGGGTGATARATVVNGIVNAITIQNPGSGYTSIPNLTIAPPPFPPRKAEAVAQIVNGFVVGANITYGGFGYQEPPTVLLIGGGGTGAKAVASVINGVVTSINITNPGTGYTSAPTFRIGSPPFAPSLSVEVSSVRVSLKIVLGWKYQIESTADMVTWVPVGIAFLAEDEELIREFPVDNAGRFFRINQVP
jgi:hypothetical protein